MLAAAGAGPSFPQVIVLASGLAALLLSVALYNSAQTVTMAHEGAHALFGVLLGGRLTSINVNPGGGGDTNFDPGMGWFARLVTGAVGYIGPSIFGLIGVLLLQSAEPASVLWVTVALLVLMMLFVKAGRWKVLAFGVLLLAVLKYGSPPAQELVALTWVWWLLIGAVVGAVKLVGILLSGGNGTDAHNLRRITWIPATIWILAFLAGALAALFVGGSALLRMAS